MQLGVDLLIYCISAGAAVLLLFVLFSFVLNARRINALEKRTEELERDSYNLGQSCNALSLEREALGRKLAAAESKLSSAETALRLLKENNDALIEEQGRLKEEVLHLRYAVPQPLYASPAAPMPVPPAAAAVPEIKSAAPLVQETLQPKTQASSPELPDKLRVQPHKEDIAAPEIKDSLVPEPAAVIADPKVLAQVQEGLSLGRGALEKSVSRELAVSKAVEQQPEPAAADASSFELPKMQPPVDHEAAVKKAQAMLEAGASYASISQDTDLSFEELDMLSAVKAPLEEVSVKTAADSAAVSDLSVEEREIAAGLAAAAADPEEAPSEENAVSDEELLMRQRASREALSRMMGGQSSSVSYTDGDNAEDGAEIRQRLAAAMEEYARAPEPPQGQAHKIASKAAIGAYGMNAPRHLRSTRRR